MAKWPSARTLRSVNTGTTPGGEGGSIAKRSAKNDKVLGSWEQRQILKHAGLDDEVSERMAAKVLETAAHVAAAGGARSVRQTTAPRVDARAGKKHR